MSSNKVMWALKAKFPDRPDEWWDGANWTHDKKVRLLREWPNAVMYSAASSENGIGQQGSGAVICLVKINPRPKVAGRVTLSGAFVQVKCPNPSDCAHITVGGEFMGEHMRPHVGKRGRLILEVLGG